MPADEAGEATVSIWSKGRFSPVSKGGSRAKAMAALSRKVGGDVRWVGGDYRQSLTPSLAVERGMRPATCALAQRATHTPA